MYGSRWQSYLEHLLNSKQERELESQALKICREIFKDVTGFKYDIINHFRNSLSLTPHRIIVKSNVVKYVPDYEYDFICLRDEFLFKPKENDWIVFMALKDDFKTAYILGKSYLEEIMPMVTSGTVREIYFKRKYFLPVEFNSVHLAYKKSLKRSHSVLHDMKILPE